MNKTTSINRLMLATVLWAIFIPEFFQGIFASLSVTQLAVVGQIYFAIPVAGYILLHKIRPKEWIPFKMPPVSVLLMSGLLGILLFPMVSFINMLTSFFATNYVGESSAQMLDNPLWVNLLIIAVIPAVMEELVYRGIIYHGYREKGVFIGAVASGLAFGIMHRNFNQFCYAMVLGMIFCVLVEITGSIYASMVTHFSINGFNVLMLELLKVLTQPGVVENAAEAQKTTASMTLVALIFWGALGVIFTSLAVLAMIWMTKRCHREAHMRWCLNKYVHPDITKGSFVTPSFIVMIEISIIYMLLMEFSSRISAGM